MSIRNPLPMRREHPSKNPTGENWTAHKPDLKIDFHSKCGYCGSSDSFRHTYFQVDHFVPKVLFRRVGGIEDCEYKNLVYSCFFCNNSKSDTWPTNDIARHNDGAKGFVDPCDPVFEQHLKRSPTGSILGNSPLGKWMVTVGFKFDQRDYAIRLLWVLDELDKQLIALEMELTHSTNREQNALIETKLHKTAYQIVKLRKQLSEYYDNL